MEDGSSRRDWGVGHNQSHKGNLASVVKPLLHLPLLTSVTLEELYTSVHWMVSKTKLRLHLFVVNPWIKGDCHHLARGPGNSFLL